MSAVHEFVGAVSDVDDAEVPPGFGAGDFIYLAHGATGLLISP